MLKASFGKKSAEKSKDTSKREGRYGDDLLLVPSHSKKARKRKKRPNRISKFLFKYGKTRLFVYGKSAVKALSVLSKVCKIEDVKIFSDGVSFLLPSKVLNQILALLNNLCYDYKILNNVGVAPALAHALTHVGIIVASAIVATVIFLYPSFVTDVKIEGDVDAVTLKKITATLSENGVKEGSFSPSLDANEIEQALMRIEGVAYAGVIRHGTHVVLTVKREEKKEDFFYPSGDRVVSNSLATVTRVIVEGGTAAVKYGDVVKPGDTLIEGFVTYGDELIPVKAEGVVYGKVYERKTVFFKDEELVKTYGRKKRVTVLSVFGKHKTPKSPFETCEVSTKRSSLGFLLPLEFVTYEFHEVATSVQKNLLSEEEMQKMVFSKIIEETREPVRILASYASFSRTDEGVNVTVTVEMEKNISG